MKLVKYTFVNGVKLLFTHCYKFYQVILETVVTVVCIFNTLSPSSADRGAGGQTGEGLHWHGHLHHYESWLCWPLQLARQPQETVPLPGHDQAWPSAHCRGHAVQSRLQICWEAGQQNCTLLQVSVEKTSSLFVVSFIKWEIDTFYISKNLCNQHMSPSLSFFCINTSYWLNIYQWINHRFCWLFPILN